MPPGFERTSRWLLLLLLFGATAAGWLAISSGGLSVAKLEELLRGYPNLAPLLFIVAHVIAALAFLPCSPFTFLAGLLWPLSIALPLSIAAAMAATMSTFLIGRYLNPTGLHSRIEHSPARRILAFTSRHGWKVVAFAFLNPVVPSATLGYAFGMSSISLSRFMVSALLSMIPLQIALVALGGMARNALLLKVWMVSGVLLLVAAVAIGLWTIIKRKCAAADQREEECEQRN